jgi:hypothetical protein
MKRHSLSDGERPLPIAIVQRIGITSANAALIAGWTSAWSRRMLTVLLQRVQIHCHSVQIHPSDNQPTGIFPLKSTSDPVRIHNRPKDHWRFFDHPI